MNEKALQRLFELAKQDGYVNTFEDFTLLLSNNEEAASTMFNLALNDGYEKSFEKFSTLIGFVKKKKRKRNHYAFTIGNWRFSAHRIIKKPAS